jgi:uncharacterized lipoprotein YehR (DUF1307 family)
MKTITRLASILFLICLTLLFSGCDGFTTSGKWLDYGNGLINMNQVNHISIERGDAILKDDEVGSAAYVKFDDFKLNVSQVKSPDLEEIKNKANGDLDAAQKIFLEDCQKAFDSNKETRGRGN